MSSFLSDFIKMRQSLGTNAGTSTSAGMPAPPKGKKGKQTVEISKPTGSSITIAYIIENEPPVDEVIEYFKNKIEALEEAGGD